MIQIRQHRKNKKLTQDELAKILDVRTATVSDWERGRKNPRSEMIPKLAEVLGVPIKKLFDSAA